MTAIKSSQKSQKERISTWALKLHSEQKKESQFFNSDFMWEASIAFLLLLLATHVNSCLSGDARYFNDLPPVHRQNTQTSLDYSISLREDLLHFWISGSCICCIKHFACSPISFSTAIMEHTNCNDLHVYTKSGAVLYGVRQKLSHSLSVSPLFFTRK